MSPHQPSRRHLLLGAIAGLFCWRRQGKADAPTPAPEPAPAPPPVQRPLVGWSSCTYDAEGRCIRQTDPAPCSHEQGFDLLRQARRWKWRGL
jgi:hypothetical protein